MRLFHEVLAETSRGRSRVTSCFAYGMGRGETGIKGEFDRLDVGGG